jgi:hypothetical protein
MSHLNHVWENLSVISMDDSIDTVLDLNQIGNATVEEYNNFMILHNLTHQLNGTYNDNVMNASMFDDDDDVVSLIDDDDSDADSMPTIEWNGSVTVVTQEHVEPIDIIVVEHAYSIIAGVVYVHDE